MLAALAVGGATAAARARPVPDGVPVLVATGALPVGSVLATGDVTLREVPDDLVPTGALTGVDEAVGRPVAAVLAEGEVLTAHDLGTPSLLVGQPEGQLAVWLPVPDPAVAGALEAGDRVDVHSPVDGSRVVPAALVLATRAGVGATGPSVLTGAGDAAAGGVWLALTPEQVTALAAVRGADPAGGALLLALHAEDR